MTRVKYIFASLVLAATSLCAAPDPVAKGQYQADLNYLLRHFSGPKAGQESNFYLDLWTGAGISDISRTIGLTNNRALFINAHGKAIPTAFGSAFAFYPHQDRIPVGAKTPYYSISDVARIVGLNATNIHNLVIASCNEEGSLDIGELRAHFPNATNIIHMAAGELGYQPMFLQTISTHSTRIFPLYEIPRTNALGRVEYYKGTAPAKNAVRMNPYVAELFQPGKKKPYRVQTAGRELLEPTLRK